MTLIEYIGANYGSQRWGGPGSTKSGRTYVFGRTERDRVRYVDNRDVAWLLGVQSDGRSVFRVYKPVEPTPVEPEPTTPDPSDLTISEIKELDLSPELWKLVLAAEKDGKNRAGAIEFIEQKIVYAQSV